MSVRPTCIVFDLDNTLYGYDACHRPALGLALATAAERFGIPLAEAEALHDAARRDVKARLGEAASAHSRLLYFLTMIEMSGRGTHPRAALELEHLYWAEYLARMELDEAVPALFTYIKARKIPIALVTDLTTAIQFRKLTVLGLHEAFDAIVTSEECQGEKRSGATFLRLLEKMDLAPGPGIWMVGDTGSDMHARTHIGATTVFNARYTGAVPEPGPDHTVNGMGELEALLKRVPG